MTMKAVMVNAGNRTGDKLHIAILNPEGEVQSKAVVRRGQQFDLLSFTGHFYEEGAAIPIKVWCESAAEDKYVETPQVLVVDQPQKL